MKKIFIVDNGSYPFDVLVAVGHTYDEVIHYIEKKKKYQLDSEEKDKLWMRGIGRTVMLKNNATVIQVEDLKDKAYFHSNLSHEIFHVVEFLMDKIGSKHNPESGETWAYQIGYLTRQIYDKLYAKKPSKAH